MRAQLAEFKASLEKFALKHKAAIKRDPAFRASFHKMCANVGVDPLASNKGFWAEVLGIGDFYYEVCSPYTEPHTTAFAWLTPFLKDFCRRLSQPTPRFQSPSSTLFNAN